MDNIILLYSNSENKVYSSGILSFFWEVVLVIYELKLSVEFFTMKLELSTLLDNLSWQHSLYHSGMYSRDLLYTCTIHTGTNVLLLTACPVEILHGIKHTVT